jgi:hypothetical protein
LGFLIWSKPNPISIGLFGIVGPGPVGPNIREFKTQAQYAMHTRAPRTSSPN